MALVVVVSVAVIVVAVVVRGAHFTKACQSSRLTATFLASPFLQGFVWFLLG